MDNLSLGVNIRIAVNSNTMLPTDLFLKLILLFNISMYVILQMYRLNNGKLFFGS